MPVHPIPLRFPSIFASVGLLALAAAPPGTAEPKFKFATGRVTYKMTSPMMSGTTVLSWIENGKKFRQDLTGTATQSSMTLKTWSLCDGAWLYSKPAVAGNQVLRMKLPKDAKQMATSGMPFIAAGKEQGKLVGKATLLGKPCEIRQIQSVKLWIWEGLPLKMESGAAQGMQVSMVATKVETPAKLSASLFELPPGSKVTDFQMPAGGMRRAPQAN